MFKILDGFVGRAETTMIGVVIVVAIFIVAATWIRTRSLAPTVGTLLLGVIVIYGVSNFEDLSKDVKKDVDEERNTPVNVAGDD
jgi:UDP-N-acetylmuramyl pentapeptide phosphotransferase/UDP-N-acetylglucosamine-1-phosphate transferase